MDKKLPRAYTDRLENTWVAMRRMYLDSAEKCEVLEDYGWLLGITLIRIGRCIKCIFVGHDKVDWPSLKDPGWVSIFCKKCGILLYMEKRK